ncbi:P-type conjugative transfer protein TrbJ [Sulfuricurvum sp.]|uniref:P-type conjugative transfer protein TrbJ n=1 Tax=Sulfuricurvum sp. TaxID=2025608 RepID=UPI00260A94F8|nr:P-type conjugative transfer protein TrbJ [Sulfuricurvum sp.]MDD2782105.1 P-type conjugative transfer protein TrbJ [Sulfuricurvum sp.]
MKVKTVLLAALLAAMPMTVSAGDGAPAPATEATQWLNYVELAAQYAKQVQQYEAQLQSLTNHIQQTQMQIKNITQLPATAWSKFENDVLNLKNIVQQGQAVTFAAANLDTQFASMFKGYSNYEAAAAGSLDARTTTFTQQYKNINQSTRDSTNGALRALNTQMNAMSSDEAVMDMLQNQSRSADGQLKAIQAANEIALHQTDTLKKLQYTLMTQASTQASYMAATNDKETAQRALSERREQYTMPNTNRPGNTRRYENWR